MKNKYIIVSLLVAALPMSSCVKDLGSNEIKPYNQITISGIEDLYSGVSGVDVISIHPEIEGTVLGKDESNYEYRWFLCSGMGDSHKHTFISEERDLNYLIDCEPSTLDLYFQVIDKTTGLYWEKTTQLTVETPFVKGLYLFGDKEDGTCGIDFISTMAQDTSVVKDVFNNTIDLKGAKDLVFTGYYLNNVALWAIADNGYTKVEYSSKQAKFNPIDFQLEDMCFPASIQVKKPMKLVDVVPHATASGVANTSICRSNRMVITDEAVFAASIISGEQYGDPINHLAGSKELMKVFPMMIHPDYSMVYYMSFFNLTSHSFNVFNSMQFYMSTGCREIATGTADTAAPFYWDQTKYTPVREPLYIMNGVGSLSVKSNCLMGDANGGRWIYQINSSVTAVPTKSALYEIDNSIATDITKATHYAISYQQPVLFYTVGNKLYAYNYSSKKAKLVGEYDDEITYIIFDYASSGRKTDLMVVSYKNGVGSTIAKYDVADDANEIIVTPRKGENWKSDLRVVKVEYRNCPL